MVTSRSKEINAVAVMPPTEWEWWWHSIVFHWQARHSEPAGWQFWCHNVASHLPEVLQWRISTCQVFWYLLNCHRGFFSSKQSQPQLPFKSWSSLPPDNHLRHWCMIAFFFAQDLPRGKYARVRSRACSCGGATVTTHGVVTAANASSQDHVSIYQTVHHRPVEVRMIILSIVAGGLHLFADISVKLPGRRV